MIKIFVVSHKSIPFHLPEIYVPIQVNTKKNGILQGFVEKDNSSVNISGKNENYCELTASYWVWKNDDAEIVGLCHYRRYFNFFNPFYNTKPSSQKRMNLSAFKNSKTFNANSETISHKIKKYLKTYDVILPQPAKQKLNGDSVSLAEYYIHEHGEKEWGITVEIIKKMYPEYIVSIEEILNKGSVFYYANMLITRKKIWDEYHLWLFSILFELEKNIEIPTDEYQKRIFGFLSERLLNLYFQHKNKYRIKHLPLIFVNDI